MIWIERFDVERSFASHISSLIICSSFPSVVWLHHMFIRNTWKTRFSFSQMSEDISISLCNKQADSFLTNWTIIVFSPTGTNAQLDGELSLIYTIHFSFAKETYSDTKYTQLSKTASQHQSRFEHYLSDKLIKRRVKYFILDQQKLNKS